MSDPVSTSGNDCTQSGNAIRDDVVITHPCVDHAGLSGPDRYVALYDHTVLNYVGADIRCHCGQPSIQFQMDKRIPYREGI